MTTRLSRAGLLRRGAVGSGMLLASGSALAALAGPAAAAATPDGDLAYLRILIGAELLTVDFQTNALGSGQLSATSKALVTTMLADENAHYTALARLLTQAGGVPATSADINFAYPKGTFDSEASIMKQAGGLEELSLGAYVGAVETVQTPELRLPIGQIAANEAQHVSALAVAGGKSAIGKAFGPALPITVVSTALDVYES